MGVTYTILFPKYHVRFNVWLASDSPYKREKDNPPQTEHQLVLELEVGLAIQSGHDVGDSISSDEFLPILVDAQHHLETSCAGVYVLVVLKCNSVLTSTPID